MAAKQVRAAVQHTASVAPQGGFRILQDLQDPGNGTIGATTGGNSGGAAVPPGGGGLAGSLSGGSYHVFHTANGSHLTNVAMNRLAGWENWRVADPAAMLTKIRDVNAIWEIKNGIMPLIFGDGNKHYGWVAVHFAPTDSNHHAHEEEHRLALVFARRFAERNPTSH